MGDENYINKAFIEGETNRAILTKAIQKAIDGGWSDYRGLEAIEFVKATNFTITLKGWVEFVDEGQTDESQTEMEYYYPEIVFTHDFVKALWGERTFEPYGRDNALFHGDVVRAGGGPDEEYYEYPVWMWHLQQMVIADDPIKYLGEHLPD